MIEQRDVPMTIPGVLECFWGPSGGVLRAIQIGREHVGGTGSTALETSVPLKTTEEVSMTATEVSEAAAAVMVRLKPVVTLV